MLFLVALLVVSCQQNDVFSGPVTSIEVREWGSGAVIDTITDEDAIDDLVDKLESANTASTADIDIPGPDYRVLFISNGETIQVLGYYLEAKTFKSVKGRFIDWEEGRHYGVTIELPVAEQSGSLLRPGGPI